MPQQSTRSLQDYQSERMKFSSSLTFVVSALGFAAGFGSVWRFPYLVFKNGGGTFLIPYFILLFTLAIPLFYLEIALGQLKGIGLAHILDLEKPSLKGFGYVGIIIVIYISTYYNLIMAYALDFFWNSFNKVLPWANETSLMSKTYFYDEMLHQSSSINDINEMVWPLYICYFLSLVLVYICIKEGVQTSGKIAIVTAIAPYIMLIILLLRGFTLDGGMEGIYYLFRPNILKLFDPLVWVDAANQVVFQLSVGQGIIILYGSYRGQKDDIPTYSILIPVLTALCGLLAACVIFSYIGYISSQTGISIEKLPLSGPDLAFVLYPAILAGMPYPNLWCLLFFGCLVLLGIDSQFGYLEGIAGTIEDAFYGQVEIFGFSLSVQHTRLLVCTVNAAVGLLYCTDAGFYVLNFVDKFGTNVGFMLIVLFECAYFCWGQRFDELEQEIKLNNNYIPSFIKISLKQICHYSVIVLLIFSLISQFKVSFNYSFWTAVFGWIMSLFPFTLAAYMYYTHKDMQPIITNNVELKLINE